MTSRSWPILGCGVGLRSQHYPVITEEWPKMDWFEAISENYMDTGGRPLHILEKVRQHYPIALHGTALSVGSIDPLDSGYLLRLKRLIERIDPFIVSDHLCWSGVDGEVLHDLLPLPLTEESIRHVVQRVEQVQESIGRQILIENVSTYVTYRHSAMPEWEFIAAVAKRSGSGILLDINNLYVNSFNHDFNPHDYLKNIPGELIGQFHLAGHTDRGSFLFDTHSAPVIDAVWELYREALNLWGPISTLIEWDEDIPPYPRLEEEAQRARKIYQEYENPGSVIARNPEGAVKQTQKGGMDSQTGIHVSLPEVQEWVKSRIQPSQEKPAAHASTETLLNPQGGVSGEERMTVYANGYLARIRESLTEVYEAVHQVLGSERFSELCETYAHRYASHHYNLNFAGKHLAELLEESHLSKLFPFLPDLAKLEWLIWEAFHAFDEPPPEPSHIQALSLEEWENVQINFQPSVRLIASAWPILDIWLSRHKSPEEVKIDLANHPQRILVGRKEDRVRCELVDENQYQLLEGLLAGRSLGSVCDELANTAEETLPLAEWFSRWVQDGLILRFTLKPLDCASAHSEKP